LVRALRCFSCTTSPRFAMFSSYERLNRRTTPKDLNRADYLQALVSEFQETNSPGAREQVLANLANFAYDPINYNHLRDLHIVDLFVDCLEPDEDLNGKIVQFGLGGLCNLAADRKNRDLILSHRSAVDLVIRCLSSGNEETVISAITTLLQLVVPRSRDRIVTAPVIACMQQFEAMKNPRFANLARIFLDDHCTAEEKRGAASDSSSSLLHIPLP